MVPRNRNIEQRIASLPIAQSERELALQWVDAGDALARLILALLHLFTPQPTLKHSHWAVLWQPSGCDLRRRNAGACPELLAQVALRALQARRSGTCALP